jgi:hypothetical protein
LVFLELIEAEDHLFSLLITQNEDQLGEVSDDPQPNLFT